MKNLIHILRQVRSKEKSLEFQRFSKPLPSLKHIHSPARIYRNMIGLYGMGNVRDKMDYELKFSSNLD